MLKNYFKLAWRNIHKDKLYSILNVAGLAVATAAFMLIIGFVRFEYSYEDFHKKADDIYRVTLELYQEKELVTTDCETYAPLGPMLKKDIPEVSDYVRIQDMAEMPELKARDKFYRVDKIYAADPSMMSVFDFEFIEGDPRTALKEPMQAVLTETTAKRLFGTGRALGQLLKNKDDLYTVTGVIKDVPANTHLTFNLLISFSSLVRMGDDLENWNGNNNYLYLLMAPGTDLVAFNHKLKKLSATRLKNEIAVAEPLKKIHLHSHKGYEPEINGDIKTVQFLMVTGLLILLVGSVNYVNLTTAKSSERIKEISMRKVLGSSRGLLIGQLLTETLFINLLAMALSLIILKLSLPAYFSLIGRPVLTGFFTTPGFWVMCLALFLFNCVLSGVYPSVVLSAVKSVSITRKSHISSFRGNLFREVLVTGQFSAALLVLSVSFVVFRQLEFLRNQDLGMETEKMLVVRAPLSNGTDTMRVRQGIVFQNELKRLPDVERVTLTEGLPGVDINILNTVSGVTTYGSQARNGYNYTHYGVDDEFIPAMKIQLSAGRNFRKGAPSKQEVLINGEAARLLGFKNPEEAIGEKIETRPLGTAGSATIIGVVKDYHQQSLKTKVTPMIHYYVDKLNFFGLKISTDNVGHTLSEVRKAWERQYPGYTFEYRFLDELYDQQYRAEEQFGKTVSVFSFITLLITCMGILGLTAYNISRRTKEIGIRKVLGATVSGIVAMLSRDFLRLILISVLVASPLAWLVMSRWLKDFAYRIELHWWMFAMPGVFIALIALSAVGIQSVKAALMNPVKSLKSD